MPETSVKTGWARVAFGEVVKLSGERSSGPEEDGFERYVGLDHIDPGDLRIRRWGDISDGTTFASVFRPGHVLFGKRRAYQRKVAVPDFSGVCSGDIYVFEPKNSQLLPDLLPFICQTDGFFEHALGTSAGSLSPRTNWKSLAGYEFSLPPLEEQRRIAEALTACRRVEDGLLSLSKEASTLRGSYLNRLFGHVGDNAIVCGELRAPSHWRLMRLPELVVNEPNALTAGPFGTTFKARDFRKSGVPIIQLRHLTVDGMRLDKLTFMDREVYRRLHTPYAVVPGDLLLTKMGEPPGLACLYPEDAEPGMVTPDVIKATLDKAIIHPIFALALFNNSRSRANMLQLCKGGTRTRVSLDELYRLRWPIPPLAEQAALVKDLRSIELAGEAARFRCKHVRNLRAEIASSFA